MCGLVGVVGGRHEDRRAALCEAVSALVHRGPDGRGLWTSDLVDFGHTRLAVIDRTSASDQPMVDVESGCVLVFNGAIYNYLELRQELTARGHRFRSSGDTEVLLRALLEWGDACLHRLNGMFAFAFFNPRRGSVLIARDRFGEKPLFLCRHRQSLWFASEVKALLAAGVLRAEVERDSLFRFLSVGDVGDQVATAFGGVVQLPAGHFAWVDPQGGYDPHKWWRLPAPIEGQLVPEELDELAGDATAVRLRSDVPVGTSLSGGVDSSLVVSLIRSARPDGELHAFTASFPGSDTDELPKASELAGRLDLELHAVRLTGADLAAGLDDLHRANESPLGSPSALAQYRVMQAAHDVGITVLLDGQGADETWGGYPKYARIALTDDLVCGHLQRARRRVAAWRAHQGGHLLPEIPRYLALLGELHRGMARRAVLWAWPRWLSATYRREHLQADPLSGIDALVHRGAVAGGAMRCDIERTLLPGLLSMADRNSMAWSREVRLPYLDHRLVELALATPAEDKLSGGWTKEPLRSALDRRGMTDVARRAGKVAYMPPTADWLQWPPVHERVREAWSRLHRLGIVAQSNPVPAPLPRWRVLSAVTWADAFGISL